MADGETIDGRRAAAHALAAARRWEPRIDAWAWLADAPPAAGPGPLAGAPFAVKDVIDVAGMPTGYGWRTAEGGPPVAQDAAVVAALRAAGAVPIGKTRSTAFAFVDPTTTRNPYDPRRTPGGSSSGSGAVVGAGVVPFALGTQTAGSLCRPAAFCGAFAWKPSLGVLPLDGVAPLSRSFDAVGVIAGSMAWLSKVHAVLAAAYGLPDAAAPARPLRVSRLIAPEQRPEPAMQAALDAASRAVERLGGQVEEIRTPVSFADLIERHRTIMLAEAARDVLPIVGGRRASLPPRLAAGLAEGEGIDAAAVAAAHAAIAAARQAFWAKAARYDLLLAAPAPGAAPIGLATTGDQSYLTPWTALGGPLVSLPAGRGGAPVGVLLAAPPGADGALVGAAAAISPSLPRTFPPTPPG